MRANDASSTIEASPDVIWAILTDAPGYTTWDSGIVRVEGRIAPGETIKVVSDDQGGLQGQPGPEAPRGSRRVTEEPRYGWAGAASGRSIASLM
jgi:Polyketide cyclase / dehydrase and lipid transport